jgi:hypothetical protein
LSGLCPKVRVTLAEALAGDVQPIGLDPSRPAPNPILAHELIDTGAVRVLDPDDPVQRGRVAKRLREIEVQAVAGIHRDDTDWAAGELIKALR